MNKATKAAALVTGAALSLGMAMPLASPRSAAPAKPTPASLEQIRDADDVAGMRRHAWDLLAMVTAPGAGGQPQWRTWHERSEVLERSSSSPGGFEGTSPSAVPSETGRQRRGGAAPLHLATALSVHFNPAAEQHVRANGYGSAETYAKLKSTFDSQGAVAAERKLADFPGDAVTVKAMWRIVPASSSPGETWVLPVFDPTERDASASYPTNKWDRSVVLDMSGKDVPEGTTADVNIPRQPRKARVVSINRFYHITLGAEQARAVNASPGDVAVLVGLHVATREIPTWVWATYWWHDRPDEGEFAAGRPGEIAGSVWGNYLMNVEFGDGRNGASKAPRRPVFNPYLEAQLKRGITSNCFSCHQQASLTSELYQAPSSPVRTFPLSDSDPTFKDRIRTGFVWSLTGVPAKP